MLFDQGHKLQEGGLAFIAWLQTKIISFMVWNVLHYMTRIKDWNISENDYIFYHREKEYIGMPLLFFILPSLLGLPLYSWSNKNYVALEAKRGFFFSFHHHFPFQLASSVFWFCRLSRLIFLKPLQLPHVFLVYHIWHVDTIATVSVGGKEDKRQYMWGIALNFF